MQDEELKQKQKRKDARPFIRDASRESEGALDTVTVTAGMVVLALIVGFIIGFAVFCVMNLSIWLTSLIWNGAAGDFITPWFPLVICGTGGVLIGIWTWWSHDTVKPLEDVMAEFKQTGSYKTNGVIRPVITFLLPLIFGGSIGFEAGLTGLITAGCCWIRDKLKAAGLRAGAVADVTIAASLSAIFGTPLAGIVAGAECAPSDGSKILEEPKVNDYNMRRGAKIVLYTAAAFGAFGGILLFSYVFGAGSGLPRFEAISAAYMDLLWAIPCLVAAYIMALLFHASSRLFSAISSRLNKSSAGTIVSPIIAGLAMGAIACAFPLVLFPGETQSEYLMENWTSFAAITLIATGMLKALVTPMCLEMGWIGGNFFPSIFAGVAVGYGIAALTGADPMLMVTVTSTAFLAGVIRKPLLVLAVLFLCFPATGVIWMGLAAIIGATLPIPHVLLSKTPKGDDDEQFAE